MSWQLQEAAHLGRWLHGSCLCHLSKAPGSTLGATKGSSEPGVVITFPVMVIPPFGERRQKGQEFKVTLGLLSEFEASLGYIRTWSQS